MRQHQHLLLLARQIQGHVLRDDFDLFGAAHFGLLGFDPFNNPLAQQLILRRAELQSLPAFMRHFRGRLEQHQALVHRHTIEAAASQIVDQRLIIEIRIVAAQ